MPLIISKQMLQPDNKEIMLTEGGMEGVQYPETI